MTTIRTIHYVDYKNIKRNSKNAPSPVQTVACGVIVKSFKQWNYNHNSRATDKVNCPLCLRTYYINNFKKIYCNRCFAELKGKDFIFALPSDFFNLCYFCKYPHGYHPNQINEFTLWRI